MNTIDLEKEIKKKLREQKTKEYGDYRENFHILGMLWSVILKNKLKEDIKPHEVANCMVMLKLMRVAENYKQDSYLDASIYLDMARDLHKEETEE